MIIVYYTLYMLYLCFDSSRERDAALKEIFAGADTNGDGQLDLKEFRAIFQRNGVC